MITKISSLLWRIIFERQAPIVLRMSELPEDATAIAEDALDNTEAIFASEAS